MGNRGSGKMKKGRWPWKRKVMSSQKYPQIKSGASVSEVKDALEDRTEHYQIKDDQLPKVYHPAEDMAYRNPPFLIVFVIIIILIVVFLLFL